VAKREGQPWAWLVFWLIVGSVLVRLYLMVVVRGIAEK